MLENVVAVIHLVSIPLGVAALMQRARALSIADNSQQLTRVFFWDNLYGLVALFWIGSGLYRVFGGVDKGTDYYLSNHAFWTKMLLAVILLGAESVPMSTFIRYRIRLAKGLPISFERKRVLLLHHWIEVWIMVGMVAMAVLMARGVGSVSTKRLADAVPGTTTDLEQPLGVRTDHHAAALAGAALSLNAPDLERGAAIYGQRCVSCHGPDGRGNAGQLAPNFVESSSRLKKPEEQLIQSVSVGIPSTSMRGFGRELNPSEIRSVVGYLRHRFGGSR